MLLALLAPPAAPSASLLTALAMLRAGWRRMGRLLRPGFAARPFDALYLSYGLCDRAAVMSLTERRAIRCTVVFVVYQLRNCGSGVAMECHVP